MEQMVYNERLVYRGLISEWVSGVLQYFMCYGERLCWSNYRKWKLSTTFSIRSAERLYVIQGYLQYVNHIVEINMPREQLVILEWMSLCMCLLIQAIIYYGCVGNWSKSVLSERWMFFRFVLWESAWGQRKRHQSELIKLRQERSHTAGNSWTTAYWINLRGYTKSFI